VGERVAEQIVELRLPNGSAALARVDQIGGGAEKTGASVPSFDFKEIGATLEGLAQTLQGALAKAAPDKVKVELGLELTVKSGKLTGLLVEGGGKGSLGITLEWGSETAST